MSSYFNLVSGAYSVMNYFISNTEDQDHSEDFWTKQEFDPHSVVYSICTGRFKGPSKPVYYVGSHVVILQPTQTFEYSPSEGIHFNIQGPMRTYQNWSGTSVANRRIIYCLYDIIHKALYWDKPHAQGNEEVKKIYKICHKGLDSFIDPYKNDYDIVNEIERCKNLIQQGLEKEVEKPAYGPLAERINELWTQQFRTVAQSHILTADNLQGNVPATKAYKCAPQIDSLEQLLQERGQQFHVILNERKV